MMKSKEFGCDEPMHTHDIGKSQSNHYVDYDELDDSYDIEGEQCHYYSDDMGKLHTIKNPHLDSLRNALAISVEDANRQVLRAHSAISYCKAFGVGCLAVMGAFCAKCITGQPLDCFDYALMAIFSGFCLGSSAYAKRRNDLAEDSLELNNALNETYSQAVAEVSEEQLQNNQYEFMFR